MELYILPSSLQRTANGPYPELVESKSSPHITCFCFSHVSRGLSGSL